MSTWLWARAQWRRWPSLVALAVLVAVTGGVALAALNGARRADTAFDRFVTTVGEPDLAAVFNFETGRLDLSAPDAPLEVFDQAASLPEVERATAATVWVMTPGPELEPWQIGVTRFAGEPAAFLVRGTAPDLDEPHEVMLNEAAAEAMGVDVGSTLVLRTAAPSQGEEWMRNAGFLEELTGPEIPVTVTGIQRSIEDVAQREDRLVTVTPAFFDAHAGEILHCTCFALFVLRDGPTESARAALERIYGPRGFDVAEVEGGALPQQAANGIDVEVTALRILALVAAVAGVFVVGQGVARELAERSRDHRVRRAFGTTSRQIVLSEVAVLAPVIGAGAVGAVALMVVASPLFPRGLAAQAETSAGLWVDPWVAVAGGLGIVATGLVLTWAMATWSARATARGRGRLAPLPPLTSPAARLGLTFVTRPGPRSRVAVGSSVLATALAVVGLLGVWSFEASRGRLLDDSRLWGLDADLILAALPSDEVDARAAAVQRPGVAALAVARTIDYVLEVRHEGAAAEVTPRAVRAIAGETGSTLVAGRLPSGPAEVAVGTGVADDLRVRVGDAVTVGGPRPLVLTVVGTVVSWGTDEVDRGFELTPEGIDAVGSTCADEGCVVLSSTALARLGPGPEGDAARARLEAAGWTAVPRPSVVDNLAQAGSVPAVLGLFLAGLGAAGLANAVAASLRRRRRDVAVARALGLGCPGSRWAMRWTALGLAALGLVLGLPLGLAAGRAAWSATAERLGVVRHHGLPWWAPLAVALLVAVVGLLLAELPARRAGAIRPAEVLREP